MSLILYMALAVTHLFLPGGIIERVVLVLVCIHLLYRLSYAVYLSRNRLIGYVWRIARHGAPELRLLRRPEKIWLWEQVALYALSMTFIVQGFYLVSAVIIVNMIVRATILERLWGRGFWTGETNGLMKQIKDYVAILPQSLSDLEA